MFDYSLARPKSEIFLDLIESGQIDCESTLKDLINYFSDDEIGDFMRDYELIEDEEEEEEEEEECEDED